MDLPRFEPNPDAVPIKGGMNKNDGNRIDRNGKVIKNIRERLPNGQKKRLRYKVSFGDTLQDEASREPIA